VVLARHRGETPSPPTWWSACAPTRPRSAPA